MKQTQSMPKLPESRADYARFREIYSKNLEERIIQRQYEHPSPSFYINKAGGGGDQWHPMPSISSIPKISGGGQMYMTGSSPGPTPDIPDSVLGNIRDAMRGLKGVRGTMESRSPTPDSAALGTIQKK